MPYLSAFVAPNLSGLTARVNFHRLLSSGVRPNSAGVRRYRSLYTVLVQSNLNCFLEVLRVVAQEGLFSLNILNAVYEDAYQVWVYWVQWLT